MRAQQITARLAEIYLEESVLGRSAPAVRTGSPRTRPSCPKTSGSRAAGRLQATKEKLGIVTIDGKKQQLQDEISDLDNKLVANRSDLKTAEVRIASLLALFGGLPEAVITQQSQAPSAAVDDTRAALVQLEARQQELAATRSDGHPQLEAVRQQIADLRTALRNQPPQQPSQQPAQRKKRRRP